MGKKIIAVKPVSEIELQFEDGEILTLLFDVRAILNINEIGGISEFLKDSSVPEMCAKIIFIGAKNSNENFTLERAREITSNLSPATITEIINEYTESMGANNGVQNEMQKKLMAQFVDQIMKK